MKYKVGDRVRVIPNLQRSKRYGEFVCNAEMSELAGEIVTITGIDDCGIPNYTIAEQTHGCQWWQDEMFEGLVEEEPMKFKVGDRVRALIEVGNEPLAVKGAVGTIVTIDNDNRPYGVEFDSDIKGHDLQGDCIDGHGWWLRTDEIELVEDEKVFTKKDIKNGDVVLRRNGDVEIVCLPLGTLICNGCWWNDFDSINLDLTHILGEDYDIVAVRRPIEPHHCCFDAFTRELGKLVYDRERDEVKEMTIAEIEKELGYSIKVVKG